MKQLLKRRNTRVCSVHLGTGIGLVGAALVVATGSAQSPGEGPALSPRVTQTQLELMSDLDARIAGRRIFATPFNLLDGLGDGTLNGPDKVAPGGRPTLQDNGIFLRMNGLDSQTCLECHSILSNASIPAKFAVGGVGGVGQSAFPGVINPDVDDSENNGYARIEGRMINPPFSFGSGGVEQLAREMTTELQALRAFAQSNPDTNVPLMAKGVSFGSISFDSGSGEFDITGVEGIGEDLVVRPFGRKGCCSTIRDFDIGAMRFHHGIEPVEVVGSGVDADDDGVVNELLEGELSAMHVFQTSLERPVQDPLTPEALLGEATFNSIGCADCHKRSLTTDSRFLSLSFPEVPTDPSQNVYRTVDLAGTPGFALVSGGGVEVPLYADLKLHDMGPELAEAGPVDPSGVFRARLAGAEPPQQGNGAGQGNGNGNGNGNGGVLDAARFFTTARLWGVADTAPYLHDGRAVTLTDAIVLHGGEAESSSNAFAALSDTDKVNLLAFLRSLRTPPNPNADLP